MELKIEKGVPLPPKKSRGGFTDTLRKMRSGESFVIPLHRRASVISCALQINVRVRTFKISDQEVRVWRV